MSGYAVVVEGDDQSGWSAYSVDLPGVVVATGSTQAECLADMREAIAFHIECLRADGEPVPPPSTNPPHVVMVDPAAA